MCVCLPACLCACWLVQCSWMRNWSIYELLDARQLHTCRSFMQLWVWGWCDMIFMLLWVWKWCDMLLIFVWVRRWYGSYARVNVWIFCRFETVNSVFIFCVHENDSMTVWQYDSMTVWRYDSMTVWQYDSMTVWQYDSMTVWQYDSMTVILLWVWVFMFLLFKSY